MRVFQRFPLGLVVLLFSQPFSTPPAVSEPAPPFLLQWGTTGSGPGQFHNTRGILAYGGFVYVADTFNGRVQKFTRTGSFVSQWGGAGNGDGQFSFPAALAADALGSIYVADPGNSRIQVFDGNGGFLRKWGAAGPGPGQLNLPSWISIDAAQDCFIGDGLIKKFTTSGTYVTSWGGGEPLNSPCLDGKYYSLGGMAVSPSGIVYAGDYNRLSCQRVEEFATDGRYVASYPMSNPTCIATDASGNFYVGQYDPPVQIAKYSPSGALLWAIPSGLTPAGNFSPVGISVDELGTVYVADEGVNRILVFGDLATSAPVRTWGGLRRIYK